MSRIEGLSNLTSTLSKVVRGARLTDETRVRALSILLWLLVLAAALGGIAGWFRSGEAPVTRPGGTDEATVAEGWAAAGFGARFVAAYLATGPENEGDLGRFLGYSPDLPATESPAPAPASVSVAGVEQVAANYWAVTAAAGDPGREGFWRVGVSAKDGHLVATGLPTPSAPPPSGERVSAAPALSMVPAGGDPIVQAVVGWATAYMCGSGELSRYLAPRVRLDAVTPAVCTQLQVTGWGAQSGDDERQLVVAEAVLNPGPRALRVSFAVEVGRRDGRWEIVELLPALPLDASEEQEVTR